MRELWITYSAIEHVTHQFELPALFHFLSVSCWLVHKIRNESESIQCCFNSLLLSSKLLAIIQYQQANLLLLARLYGGEEPHATNSRI